jgi:hypothetical protein
VKTYKFLARGAVGPFSGTRWPEPEGRAPGAWVEAEGTLALCVRGAHLCRPLDLAHWLHDELWETEADGDQVEGLDCLIVQRARLVRRIDGWQQGGAARFAEACTQHAAELALAADAGLREAVRVYLDDGLVAASAGFPAVSAHCAAVAVARMTDPADEAAAFRRERSWQSTWITRAVIDA